jgi:histidinol phosphate phosphatase HisJ family
MLFYDNHTHTNFSPDSKMTIREAILTATNSNLSGIAFTDHLDLHAPNGDNRFFFNPHEQQSEIEKVFGEIREEKLLSGRKFEVLKGIEVGLQPNCMGEIKNFTNKYKFDTVVASIHFIDNVDPYFGEYFIGKNYKEAYGRALEVMYNSIKEFEDFDILGHFDYVCRYSNYNEDVRNITLKEFGDYLDPILKYLANNGKTFEINTKTYMQYKGFTPTLDINILKRFKEFGGEAVSLGSDAHNINRIGDNFSQFAQIIKNCGFNYLVYFKERKPQFYKL